SSAANAAATAPPSSAPSRTPSSEPALWPCFPTSANKRQARELLSLVARHFLFQRFIHFVEDCRHVLCFQRAFGERPVSQHLVVHVEDNGDLGLIVQLIRLWTGRRQICNHQPFHFFGPSLHAFLQGPARHYFFDELVRIVLLGRRALCVRTEE